MSACVLSWVGEAPLGEEVTHVYMLTYARSVREGLLAWGLLAQGKGSEVGSRGPGRRRLSLSTSWHTHSHPPLRPGWG